MPPDPVNIGPCDCCPPECTYVECECCEAPCDLVPDRYRFTFNDQWLWLDASAHFVHTLTNTVDVIGGSGCSWVAGIPSNSPGGDPSVQFICCDGVWYLGFFAPSIDVTSSCHWLVFEIEEEFDCCENFPQTLTLTPLFDVSGICSDLFPCSDPSEPPFYIWPTEISVTLANCECPTDCNICTDCCDPETECTPATMFATIDSPGCAGIDGIVVELTYDGIDTWTGTAETDCTTCHTVVITLTCDGVDWSHTINIDGTSPNPDPPPDDLECVETGIPFGCTAGLVFDCVTMTGVATFCLASLGEAPGSGSACCSTGGVPTTITFAA